ncbi:uncharacterized protein AMSG_07383 [Thecamonas trahens ATCC 50062]|uniref:Uncharacterized protein n=1 Tax=Thecamonas trahens ATCC 50062 TaxID=461836 RepID=A0A0L0DGA6_THETB|nr:hypothetical protein AMSG_07383 [Thecamonas trahens ATCC 50062]KNC51367.1 hypothetical protein AMSG_07383 [Thecamonas trahens ATCC 50062]|eukprot:XP_013756285.1 hypothetical protein AMSG_07383 [Thecamonas trahens ATCC 50062]
MKIVAFLAILAITFAIASAHFSISSVSTTATGTETVGLRGGGDIGSGGNTDFCGVGAAANVSTTRFSIGAGATAYVKGTVANSHGNATFTAQAAQGASPTFNAQSDVIYTGTMTYTSGQAFSADVVIPTSISGDATVQIKMATSLPPQTSYYQCVDATVTAAVSTGSSSAAATAAPTAMIAAVVAIVAFVAALL